MNTRPKSSWELRAERAERAEARCGELLAALKMILAEPHGCPIPTWDDHQQDTLRLTCVRCGRFFEVTPPLPHPPAGALWTCRNCRHVIVSTT